MDELPPQEELISMFEAGRLLVPARSRRAVYQLAQRGVLRSWKDGGHLWTTERAVRDYAATARGRPQVRSPRGQEAQLRQRIDALESVIAQQATEITELKIALATKQQAVTFEETKKSIKEIFGMGPHEEEAVPSQR